jgi:hypothetical protein
MSTIGYSASGRSAAGMMSAGTNLARPVDPGYGKGRSLAQLYG